MKALLASLTLSLIAGKAIAVQPLQKIAFGSSHVFRKIMLRMDTWLNFVKP
jgi:hypothetical protein